MKRKVMQIDMKDVCGEADGLFRARLDAMIMSGRRRSGRKLMQLERSAEEARIMFEEKAVLRCAVSDFYDHEFAVSGSGILLERSRIVCNVFERLAAAHISRVTAYAVTVAGMPEPEDAGTCLFCDMWATAYIDTVRALIKRDLCCGDHIIYSFGPGFYGMEIAEMKKLDEILDFSRIGISVNDTGMLTPLRSCSGIYVDSGGDTPLISDKCLYCRGNSRGCRFCAC